MSLTPSAPLTGTLPEEPGARRASGPVVPVLAFVGITVAVMQTLVVPVIKDLPVLLHTSASDATWVVTATLLAGAVATPIMGRLGDLYGKRRMLLASLAVMVVGSLVSAFTGNLLIMIAGRALQGFAMGAIPLGIGIMRDELPPEKLGSAMALMSSSIGVGGGLALPAAALVAQNADWHALFFGTAGIGVLAIVLTLLVVPESARRAPGTFDWAGALGLSAGLVALLLPVTKGSDWGWGSSTTLGLFGLSVVILLLWGAMELRAKAPLVDLRTTARREVLLTNLASIMVGVAFYVISLVLPQVLQLPRASGAGLGRSIVVAGLAVAPLGLTMMLTAPLYARIAARRGPKTSLVLGMVVIALGYGGGLFLLHAVWQTVVISVVVGAGIGLAYSALPTLIIGSVDASETGAATGLNTLMRSIGTSASSAVVGMVLARTAAPVGGVQLPTMTGFRTSFLIATAAMAAGLALAAFIPAHRSAAAAPAAPDPGPGERTAPAEHTRVVAGSGGFTGRVTGEDGGPVARATVTLIDRRGGQAARTVADEDGRYTVLPPTAGTYVVAGSAAGHGPLARSAAYPGRGVPVELDLVLPPAGSAPRRAGVHHGAPAFREGGTL